MTTIDLYRKHKAGEISREKFLYEVRRDNKLPFITNLTSYDDAVKILKNKGIVTEVDTKEAKAAEAVKAEVKPKAVKETKKQLNADQVQPYEYRLGIQCELNKMGEYSDESLEKAKEIVLKNLNKDFNYYTNEKYAERSPYTFKPTETDKPGMQAKADGYLKKELKKNEKSNVKDNLGKKEAGKIKPKGVTVMPDKGVTGSQKTIKEGLEELKKRVINKYVTVEIEDDGEEYPMLNKTAVANYLKSVIDPSELKSVNAFMRDDEGFDESSSYFFEDNYADTTEQEVEDWAKQEMSYYLFSKPDEFPGKEDTMEEGSFMGGTDLGTSEEDMELANENAFEDIMKKYDWYAEMSDDSRKWDAQQAMNSQLKMLAKKIGAERATEIWNNYAPENRKVQASFFMMREDKISKIKEALKKALKEDKASDELAKKAATQAERAKVLALNKQKSELNADTTKSPEIKRKEKEQIDLKLRTASDTLNKLNQGKITVV